MKNKFNSILIVSALFVTLCLPMAASAGIMLDRVVAVVNDEAITWGELYRAMEFEISRDKRSLTAEQKKAIFEENEARFLEKMIDQKLQLQEANKLRIGISEREVDATIEGIKQKYAMTNEDFIKALSADGFTMEDYRQRLAEQIVISKLVDFAVRSEIVITDEDLKGMPEGDAFYGIAQIFIKDGAGAQEKANAAMAEIEAGADFASVARKYSDDSTASSGGDFGLVQKSKMSREFSSAVEGLVAGDIAPPFKTDRGIHIIKITEIRGVRDVLSEEQLAEAYAKWLRGLRENAFIEIRLYD